MSNCQNLQEPEDRKKEKLKEGKKKKKRCLLTWGETLLQNFSICFYHPQPILFNANLPK